MKRVIILALLLGLTLLVGCKDKSQEYYQKGLAEASTAFEVNGNTKVDAEKNKDNLGLTAEKKKKEESQRVSEQSQKSADEELAQAEAEGKKYEYVINTDTFLIHDINCEDVDLHRPTFRIWKGTLEEAEAQGYTPHAGCLGNK